MTRLFLPAGAALGLLVCMAPNSNLDLPWHLAAGRSIVERAEIPARDAYSWTREGRPWMDFEWGSQVVFHLAERAGGAPGLWLLKSAGFAALMIPFLALLRLWGLPDPWIGLALFPYMLAFLPFLNLRPELASFLLASTQLYLLEARRLGALRWKAGAFLALHLVLYAAWANLHAGFPVGLLLCACYGNWLAAAAGTLGTFLNPYGPRIYEVLLIHARQLPVLRAHVREWHAPDPRNLYLAPYWILLAFCGLAFALERAKGRRPPRSHYLAGGLIALSSLQAYRHTAYLPLLVFPLALRAFHAARPTGRLLESPRKVALAAAFLFLAYAGFTTLRREGIFTGFERGHPAAGACGFLRSRPELAGLRLFNPMGWGGYLDSAIHPPYRVFLDGRYIFTDYLPLIAGAASTPESWRAFLDAERIELVLLDRDIRMSPDDWALLYRDGAAWIWLRRLATRAAEGPRPGWPPRYGS